MFNSAIFYKSLVNQSPSISNCFRFKFMFKCGKQIILQFPLFPRQPLHIFAWFNFKPDIFSKSSNSWNNSSKDTITFEK